VHNTGASAGRLLLAAEAIERGDLLAAIPLDMAFSQVTHGGNASMKVRMAVQALECRDLAPVSHCFLSPLC
jgi:hypothetical protein